MGESEMERELADALKEIREETREGFARLEGRIDGATAMMHGHALEDARNFAIQEAKAESAHKRIDEHLEAHTEDRRGRFSLWIGVILAGVASLFGLIVNYFKKGGQ